MAELDDSAVARLSAVLVAPPGDHPRYRFDGAVASGGMGVVYRAWDRVLDREVAVKVVRESSIGRELAERLTQEARILARLDHPGLIPVYDAGVLDDGRAFYAMRLVRGARLDEHLDCTRSLAERLRLFLRVTEPVSFAHAQGVVHRDLKPANIMVGPFGEVVVLDWGIAKIRGGGEPPGSGPPQHPGPPGSTGPGAVLGTHGFMAPEQAAGASGSVDERADVYSLGAILKVLLEGLDSPPPRPLAAVVRRATARDAGDRYATVTELSADISRFIDGSPVSAYREGPLERLGRGLAQHRTAVALVTAYLVLRLVLLAFGGR